MGWTSALAVAAGAAIGALVRWQLGIFLNPLFPSIPLGTLAANLIGAFIMGLALGVFPHFEHLSAATRLFITTGFLGGLTTFSTFSAETTSLLLDREHAWAAGAILAHVGGSLVMTLLGIRLIHLFFKA